VTDGEQVQMYISAEIDGNEMRFVVRTINDRIVDQFTLMKLPPQSVTIDQKNVSVAVGESVKLTATVMPESAYDKSVTWSVSGESKKGVVHINPDGTVMGDKQGTATIRAASTIDPFKYAEITVTVTKKSKPPKPSKPGKDDDGNQQE